MDRLFRDEAMPPPPLIDEYSPPDLRVGSRAFCLFRGVECVVTSWTTAPIPWPRIQPVGSMGGSGLLVDETLLRAIRIESARALHHWFGISFRTISRWRKNFGVTGDPEPLVDMEFGFGRAVGSRSGRRLSGDPQ